MEGLEKNQRRIDDLDALVIGTKRLTTRYNRTNYSLTRGSTESGESKRGGAYVLYVGGRTAGNSGANAGKLFRSLWQMPYAVIHLDPELNILEIEGDRNTVPPSEIIFEIIDKMISESADLKK